MEHTQQCRQNQRRLEADRREYLRKWPNHCTVCKGWGGDWVEFDPSPPGVSLSPGSMVEFDPCQECAGKGICPRCRSGVGQDLFKQKASCPHCGFVESETEGLPDGPECECWELWIEGDWATDY